MQSSMLCDLSSQFGFYSRPCHILGYPSWPSDFGRSLSNGARKQNKPARELTWDPPFILVSWQGIRYWILIFPMIRVLYIYKYIYIYIYVCVYIYIDTYIFTYAYTYIHKSLQWSVETLKYTNPGKIAATAQLKQPHKKAPLLMSGRRRSERKLLESSSESSWQGTKRMKTGRF